MISKPRKMCRLTNPGNYPMMYVLSGSMFARGVHITLRKLQEERGRVCTLKDGLSSSGQKLKGGISRNSYNPAPYMAPNTYWLFVGNGEIYSLYITPI